MRAHALLATFALSSALAACGSSGAGQEGAPAAGPEAPAARASVRPPAASEASPPPAAARPAAPAPSSAGAASEAADRDGLDRGDPAPDFTLPVLGGRPGETVTLSRIVGPGAGKDGPDGAIVGFVASWCGRCTASLPTLAALEREHGDRLRIVLLAIDDTPEARMEEARKVAAAGLRAKVADPTGVPGLLDAWMGARRNIPRFYLLDRRGTVRVRDQGFGKKMARLLPRQVDWLLNRSLPDPARGAAPARAESVDPALDG